MNPFLLPHGDVPFKPPRRAYARFEQSEPTDLEDAKEAVVAFSAVSVDWFEKQGDDSRFDLSQGEDIRGFWANYWANLFSGGGGSSDFEADPFEGMPFLRYEITIKRGDDKTFERYSRIATEFPPDSWWVLDQGMPDSVVADVYGNLFGVGQEAPVGVYQAEKQAAKALDEIFDMREWPSATVQDITDTLASVAREAVSIAVLDVGQGSATALLDHHQMPFLYHDLGAGITRNARTTPSNLQFCWTEQPPIVLSHWDKDHWAGALKDNRALQRTWIVPRQTLKPGHTLFANSILQAGGTIQVWPGAGFFVSVPLSTTQSLLVAQCKGQEMNGNCLAIRVDNQIEGRILHWLATGDSGYDELPYLLPGQVVAMTVPHHGAKMKVNKNVPSPAPDYARLLYSFGPGNAHGRTSVQHPTAESIAEHNARGWNTGTWFGVRLPGSSVAGGNVLATAQHSNIHLYGAIAGWDTPPKPGARPCNLSECTTEIRQS